MTERWDGFEASPARTVSGRRRTAFSDNRCGKSQPFPTVPLLCFAAWCGFKVKRLHHVHGGLAQAYVVQGGPQVDDVPLLAAGGVETLEGIGLSP